MLFTTTSEVSVKASPLLISTILNKLLSYEKSNDAPYKSFTSEMLTLISNISPT